MLRMSQWRVAFLHLFPEPFRYAVYPIYSSVIDVYCHTLQAMNQAVPVKYRIASFYLPDVC